MAAVAAVAAVAAAAADPECAPAAAAAAAGRLGSLLWLPLGLLPLLPPGVAVGLTASDETAVAMDTLAGGGESAVPSCSRAEGLAVADADAGTCSRAQQQRQIHRNTHSHTSNLSCCLRLLLFAARQHGTARDPNRRATPTRLEQHHSRHCQDESQNCREPFTDSDLPPALTATPPPTHTWVLPWHHTMEFTPPHQHHSRHTRPLSGVQ